MGAEYDARLASGHVSTKDGRRIIRWKKRNDVPGRLQAAFWKTIAATAATCERIAPGGCAPRVGPIISAAAGAVALPCLALAADAPSPLVLDEWGIYEAGSSRTVADGAASFGARILSADIHLIEKTHDICARLGVRFGIRFHLMPSTLGFVVPLTEEVTHPPLPAIDGRPQTRDIVSERAIAGRPLWNGWIFTHQSEIVNGTWKFALSTGGTPLLEDTFNR